MRKGKFLLMFTLLALMLNVRLPAVMAQEPDTGLLDGVSLSATVCSGQTADEQIRALAMLIVNDQVSKEVRSCYQTLSDRDKARVFEAMAVQRGISVHVLREEARQDMLLRKKDSQIMPLGQNWTQLIERAWWAFDREIVSVSDVWWSDATCDDDPSDVEYIFQFQFATPVNDPDALRTISSHLGVDAMLLWYQVLYGGTKGFGNTDSKHVYDCIGDSAAEAAGGVETVRDHLKMFR